MVLSLVRLLSLLTLLAGLTAVHGLGLTNAERLARGLPLAKPRRLFEPTRVQHAKRSNAPTVMNGRIGVAFSGPVFIEFYIAPETGDPSSAPAVAPADNSNEAVVLTYQAGSPGVTTGFSNSGNYISTCCQTNHCWIDPNDGSYVTLAWTDTFSPAGAYPGGTGSATPASEPSCSGIESLIFTVDESSGLITVQYINPVDPSFYPVGTTIPPQYVTTNVLFANDVFYLTGNLQATINLLGGGETSFFYAVPQ